MTENKPGFWAVHRDVLPKLRQMAWSLREDAQLRATVAAELEAHTKPQITRFAAARGPGKRTGSQVAVVPLKGLITPQGSFMSILFGGGGGGLMAFRENLREAVADPEVSSVLLDVDSPGGIVDLVPETGEEIRALREQKPIIAISNTMAASAAYWLASQATELVVTPSGDVGSVGVYQLHEDWSGWNEQRGIDPTYVFAGKFKTEGNPNEPLSDEAKAYVQGHIDELYSMFKGAVAEGRGVSESTVESDFGQGRMVMAKDAVKQGMADRVGSFEEVIGAMVQGDLPTAGVATAENAIQFIDSAGGKSRLLSMEEVRAMLELPKAEEPEEEPEEEPDDADLEAVEDEDDDLEPEAETDDDEDDEGEGENARARAIDLLVETL